MWDFVLLNIFLDFPQTYPNAFDAHNFPEEDKALRLTLSELIGTIKN